MFLVLRVTWFHVLHTCLVSRPACCLSTCSARLLCIREHAWFCCSARGSWLVSCPARASAGPPSLFVCFSFCVLVLGPLALCACLLPSPFVSSTAFVVACQLQPQRLVGLLSLSLSLSLSLIHFSHKTKQIPLPLHYSFIFLLSKNFLVLPLHFCALLLLLCCCFLCCHRLRLEPQHC